jgi:phage tail tape-measure protein
MACSCWSEVHGRCPAEVGLVHVACRIWVRCLRARCRGPGGEPPGAVAAGGPGCAEAVKVNRGDALLPGDVRWRGPGRAQPWPMACPWVSVIHAPGGLGVGSGGACQVAGQRGVARGGTRDEIRSFRERPRTTTAPISPTRCSAAAGGAGAWPGPTVSRRPDLPR